VRIVQLGVFLIAVAGCGKTQQAEHAPVPPPPSQTGPAGLDPMGSGAPVTLFGSEQIYKAHKDDPDGIEAKYKGRSIEVKGRVTSIQPWNGKNGTAIFLVGDPSKNYDWVCCRLPDAEPWKKVLPGQTVTVAGTFAPLSGAGLKDCRIVAIEGIPPEPIDVSKLAADLASAPGPTASAFDRPKDHSRIFTGKIAGTQTKNGDTIWQLEAPEGSQIGMTFSPLLMVAPPAVKVGQRVKFVATIDIDASRPKSIEFTSCLVAEVTP
jgi:hypothetical protein